MRIRDVFAIGISFYEALEGVFCLESGVLFIIKRACHEIDGLVCLGSLAVFSEDNPTFLNGFGVFIHRLRRGFSLRIHASCLCRFEIFASIIHSVVQPTREQAKCKQRNETEAGDAFHDMNPKGLLSLRQSPLVILRTQPESRHLLPFLRHFRYLYTLRGLL